MSDQPLRPSVFTVPLQLPSSESRSVTTFHQVVVDNFALKEPIKAKPVINPPQ